MTGETHTTEMLRWIPVLPLITAAIGGLAGAKLQKAFGKTAIAFLACTPIALSFAVAVSQVMHLAGLVPAERLIVDEWFTWMAVGTMHVNVAFALDPLSAVMILVVTGIGGLIHVYSIGYMHDEPAFWRFFTYLNLFMFAMLTLVLADNLLLMFVGWEGVGLCSWALIGFWYKDIKNAAAGSKAFIVNRVGDFGFSLGVFLLFWALDGKGEGTIVFREIADKAHLLANETFWGMHLPTLVGLLLFVGAAGKSAQIPLYVWLPDAMAGPTPVSALIHAATMVTAGVYMIARMNPIFHLAPDALAVVAWVGAATAIFAASIGLAQNDIKKVLAYSTVSQLGYMFLGVGVGAYAAGIFHLMTHAFFKACLFLGSGSVIHAMGGEQDMRKMGGLRASHAAYVLDLPGLPRSRSRLPADGGLLLQGRDPLASVLEPAGPRRALGDRRLRRGAHRVLHDAPGLHGVLRQLPRRRAHEESPARVTRGDDGALDHLGGGGDCLGLYRPPWMVGRQRLRRMAGSRLSWRRCRDTKGCRRRRPHGRSRTCSRRGRARDGGAR